MYAKNTFAYTLKNKICLINLAILGLKLKYSGSILVKTMIAHVVAACVARSATALLSRHCRINVSRYKRISTTSVHSVLRNDRKWKCVFMSPQMNSLRQSNELYVTTITDYNDVIMSAMASQITSLTIVYSTIYSDQRKRKSSEFTGDRWIPRTKGQYLGKCIHLMTSSCHI